MDRRGRDERRRAWANALIPLVLAGLCALWLAGPAAARAGLVAGSKHRFWAPGDASPTPDKRGKAELDRSWRAAGRRVGEVRLVSVDEREVPERRGTDYFEPGRYRLEVDFGQRLLLRRTTGPSGGAELEACAIVEGRLEVTAELEEETEYGLTAAEDLLAFDGVGYRGGDGALEVCLVDLDRSEAEPLGCTSVRYELSYGRCRD